MAEGLGGGCDTISLHLDWCGKLLAGTSQKAIAVIQATNENRHAPELTVKGKNGGKYRHVTETLRV